jgi:hypothetical protein
VPSRALFQARTGTRVEPPTFRKLAELLPRMKESKVPGFEPTAIRGKWFEVNDLNRSATDAPNSFSMIDNFTKALERNPRKESDARRSTATRTTAQNKICYSL